MHHPGRADFDWSWKLTDSISSITVPFGPRGLDSEANDTLPKVFLEIQRGQTAFPVRPILGNRFLIGSASCCDLCLGSAAVPQLHSILNVNGTEVELEAISQFPSLKVNGESVQRATLRDADVIEIGKFSVIARITEKPAAPHSDQINVQRQGNVKAILEPEDEPELVETLEAKEESAMTQSDSNELEKLSAEELVDLIENEEQMIDEFEEKRGVGAEALIQLVRDRTAMLDGRTESEETLEEDRQTVSFVKETLEREIESVSKIDEIPEEVQLEMHQDVENVLERLQTISNELDRRAEKLSRREEGYAEAAAALLDAQYKLATQLEMLIIRLSSLKSDDSDDHGTRRAVA